MNFRNMGDLPPQEASNVRQSGNRALARQSSVYSLTFDEFQNTFNGIGKDFGSMNMDELLKNIWTAEETQNPSPATAAAANQTPVNCNGLQRQGSFALPRTISQKTVDEVWRDMLKEANGCKNGSDFTGHVQQRQQTLGEMTLEQFLARAGVVREESNAIRTTGNPGFFGDLIHVDANAVLPPGVQNSIRDASNFITNQVSNIGFGVDNTRSPHAFSFGSTNSQLDCPNVKASILAFSNPPVKNNMIPFRNGVGVCDAQVGGGSPANVNQTCSNVNGKGSVNTSPSPPVPHSFNGGSQGRKTGALEKVIERRQRRMIKNRESAARSRARKQAYTMELEAEVAKLKELNMELQRKQEEIVEIQKRQILENNCSWVNKKPCLRRTLTGPW